jgi:hypothetical protein
MGRKQTSIYFEDEFINLIKIRSDKENIKMNGFVETAVEKQFLFPFFSWRHLQNYNTILKLVRYPKNEDPDRKALFYIAAYDGILMEYIDKIYRIEGKEEILDIPKELSDLIHPEFDLGGAGIELFSSSTINNMEYALEWFYDDKNEMQVVLNAFLIAKGIISINDDLYRFKQSNMFPKYDPNKVYDIKLFKKSLLYKQCNKESQELLQELFSLIKENNMDIIVNLSDKDAFTFTLNTTNNKRIAIITLSNELSYLRIGINKLPMNAGGSTTYCNSKYDLQEWIIDDLLAKYQELQTNN